MEMNDVIIDENCSVFVTVGAESVVKVFFVFYEDLKIIK